jgi:hypothetical protein
MQLMKSADFSPFFCGLSTATENLKTAVPLCDCLISRSLVILLSSKTRFIPILITSVFYFSLLSHSVFFSPAAY